MLEDLLPNGFKVEPSESSLHTFTAQVRNMKTPRGFDGSGKNLVGSLQQPGSGPASVVGTQTGTFLRHI